MSIFSKSAATGKYSIPDIDIDPGFSNAFEQEHQNKIARRYWQWDTIPNDQERSYILQNNGDLDTLYQYHSSHMNDVKDYLPTSHRQYAEKFYDYDYPSSYISTYEKIHHFFNGAFRIYKDNNTLEIAGFQIPTQEQLNGLENLIEHVKPYNINIDLKLNYPKDINNPDDNFYHGQINDFNKEAKNWPEIKQFFESFSNIPNTNQETQEAQERHLKLKTFRTPDWVNEKPTFPNTLYNGTNISKEEINRLQQYTPPIVKRQQYMTASSLNNLIKYAEILDNKKEYIKSDMIINFIKESMSAEDIDWSQPNAYVMYMDAMDAMKQKEQQPIAQESNKLNNKNPVIRRLRDGVYNDLLITDLAKVAETLGFEVSGNGAHFKFTDKLGRLRNSPNDKYKSGTVLMGGHSTNNQGVADYKCVKDFANVLKYLGYL